MRVAGLEPVLESSTDRAVVEPITTAPKLSDVGATVRVEGFDSPTREMNSSEVVAFEEISMALMRVVASGAVDVCGVKVMVRGQLAPGWMVGQLPATVKFGVV